MTRLSMIYVKDLVDFALVDYNSSEKSPNFGDFTVAWYILSKTGIAEHLSLSNRSAWYILSLTGAVHLSLNNISPCPSLRRWISIPRGRHGKSINLGSYYFYVNSMVCSHKWGPDKAEMTWQALRSLARDLTDYNNDLNDTLWGDLRFVPFGEEAAYAFKCLKEKKMMANLFGKLSLGEYKYYSDKKNIDYLTVLHMIYFDLGEKEAKKFIKWHWPLYPSEFSKMKKVVKNPKELSTFIESITSAFAEEGNENWRGEEARQYRTLSALHYLYPEVIENASPSSKNYLIEKLNKRLAKIISSKKLDGNWEILYILRIFELIGVDLSVHISSRI